MKTAKAEWVVELQATCPACDSFQRIYREPSSDKLTKITLEDKYITKCWFCAREFAITAEKES